MKQTDYVILGLLSEAPMTGYLIKQLIDIRFKFFWNESYGQLYPELRALCAAGYIEEQDNRDARARSKKTFALPPSGMAALREWLARPVQKESFRIELLLKMYFSHLIDANAMFEHVHASGRRTKLTFARSKRSKRSCWRLSRKIPLPRRSCA